MKTKLIVNAACVLLMLMNSFVCVKAASARRMKKRSAAVAAVPVEKGGSMFIAVSGDSRDCGDLIMPKVARDIADNRTQAPVEFYWHLGDLRAMYRIDCDMLLLKYPNAQCPVQPGQGPEPNAFNDYLKFAWDDYIERQIKPFGSVPFILGIGNHELINRTREDFECRFNKWLTQPLLASQLKKDVKRNIPTLPVSTYYHFIKNGVDFIYLDNSDNDASFSAEQLAWLAGVLAADAKDKSVKTIIAGMHAALPQSSERGHAMDMTCNGVCTGLRAYDLLYDAQNLSAPPARRKHVYVFASHSHFFRENIYDTPEHQGKVLPGWIIGTGGAEQYKKDASEPIMYGYLQVEIRPDGTASTHFREVTRDSPPLATGAGASALTTFCFEQNRRPPSDKHESNCQCGVTN
ncbi:MAG: metallophosphoesterase [Pyrinomonadaceae bacterium]